MSTERIYRKDTCIVRSIEAGLKVDWGRPYIRLGLALRHLYAFNPLFLQSALCEGCRFDIIFVSGKDRNIDIFVWEAP